MCLNCALSSFQEKSSGFDEKEDFRSKFKEDQMMEEVSSTKKSKTADNTRETGHARECHRGARPCTPGREGHNWPCHRTGSRAFTHSRPCASRTAVRGCTASRAWWHGRAGCPSHAVLRFFGLLFQFWLHFAGLLLDLLESIF